MLTAIGVFVAAALSVLVVGPRMARTASRLGEVTGMGGALFGVVFLAMATDLPEITLTPVAVVSGSPRIAIGSLLGSAAAQLVLLAVVDMAFRRGKLYGRVPLLATAGQCGVLLAVLSVPLLVAAGAPVVGPIGVGTVLLPLAYVGALAASRGIGDDRPDSPGSEGGSGGGGPEIEDDDRASSLWLRFAGFAVVLAGAGVALESTTDRIGGTIGIGETAAGALLAGVASSLPELVTAVSAARAGALDLAVGDIVGSSALDVALLSLADVFYSDGTVFDLLGPAEFTLLGVALALASLLVVGLARHKPVSGPRVGIESYLMIGVYGAGVAILLTSNGAG